MGQQGSLTRVWARKGTRPRAVRQQQFLYQYIFGAVCPSQGTCAAIVVPCANGACLTAHLEEISRYVPDGRHGVIVMDQAGWHVCKDLVIPENLSILHLPAYSPELNAQENIWQYLKQTALSNRVFKSAVDIIDACCQAWNDLAHNPSLITSIAFREWALLNVTYLS